MDDQKEQIWCCAIVGTQPPRHEPTIRTLVLTFGVRACNYAEAIGKATLIHEKFKSDNANYTDQSCVVVNAYGEGAIIDNIDMVSFTKVEPRLVSRFSHKIDL